MRRVANRQLAAHAEERERAVGGAPNLVAVAVAVQPVGVAVGAVVNLARSRRARIRFAQVPHAVYASGAQKYPRKPRQIARGADDAGAAPGMALRRADAPGVLRKAQGAQHFVFEVLQKGLPRQPLHQHVQHIGRGGVVVEQCSGRVIRRDGRVKERVQPVHPIHAGLGIRCAGGVGRGHHQQVANGGFRQIRVALRGQLIREIIDDFVRQAQFPFVHQTADGRAGESFADGIHPVFGRRRKRRPIPFGKHAAVPHHQKAMVHFAAAVQRTDKRRNPCGGHTDRFRPGKLNRIHFFCSSMQ